MSDSEAWRKPYQDVQDLRMNRMYFSCSFFLLPDSLGAGPAPLPPDS